MELPVKVIYRLDCSCRLKPRWKIVNIIVVVVAGNNLPGKIWINKATYLLSHNSTLSQSCLCRNLHVKARYWNDCLFAKKINGYDRLKNKANVCFVFGTCNKFPEFLLQFRKTRYGVCPFLFLVFIWHWRKRTAKSIYTKNTSECGWK